MQDQNSGSETASFTVTGPDVVTGTSGTPEPPVRQGRMEPDPEVIAATANEPKPLSPEDLEQQVMARRKAREVAADAPPAEPRQGRQLLAAAAKVKDAESHDLQPVEIADALDFFLASEQDADMEVEPKELKLNLGTKDKPRFVKWTITPIDDTEITRIRKESAGGTRAQRRSGGGEVDEAVVSRKLVVRATIDPDPVKLALTLNVVDPSDAVHTYFKKFGKTGLITQISGEILSISGWDDEDIQEIDAARG